MGCNIKYVEINIQEEDISDVAAAYYVVPLLLIKTFSLKTSKTTFYNEQPRNSSLNDLIKTK